MGSTQENLIANLKRIRFEHRLSMEKMAERCDIPVSTYIKYESAQFFPRPNKLEKIAKAFDLAVTDLLEDPMAKREAKSALTAKKLYSDIRPDMAEIIAPSMEMFRQKLIAIEKKVNSMNTEGALENDKDRERKILLALADAVPDHLVGRAIQAMKVILSGDHLGEKSRKRRAK